MSLSKPLNIAIAGCGNIAGPYGTSIKSHPDTLRLVGCFDPVTDRMTDYGRQFECKTYGSLEDLLADSEVDLVINLTVHTAHSTVTRQALEAGKHVHSEKPLATNRAEGEAVVRLAEERGLRLGCSPFIILGESQQTLWKQIREGRIGKPLVAYGEMNWHRIERWHPNPAGFFAEGAGPLLDVGCYPLNVLTSILGPVRSVSGSARILLEDREVGSGPNAGTKFKVTSPDHVVGNLEFANGVMGRLTCSFVVGPSSQTGVEIHGELGGFHIDSVGFNAGLRFASSATREWEEVPPVVPAFEGIDWSRGVGDIADALAHNRPHRCTGAQAYHILDVCLSILESAEQGKPVEVKSRFELPSPALE